MNRLLLTAAACLALLPLAGCRHIQTPPIAFSDDGEYLPHEVGDGLVADPNGPIPDVPMPVGFKPVTSQCTFRVVGQVRVVHHVYQGHAKPGDAVRFYQNQLPERHWTLVDIQAVGESTVLRYAKGPEQLAVTTKHGWGITTVTIDIEAR